MRFTDFVILPNRAWQMKTHSELGASFNLECLSRLERDDLDFADWYHQHALTCAAWEWEVRWRRWFRHVDWPAEERRITFQKVAR